MKVALYLPGMLRQFELPYKYLKKYVLEPLNPDVFFSGYPNDDGIKICHKKIRELYSPKKYILREFDDEIKKIIYPNGIEKYYSNKRSETKPLNYISGRYNIKICNELRKNYEQENNVKYDVIICSRTDIFYDREYSQDEILKSKNGEILIPHGWDFKEVHPSAVSDIGIITNPDNMDVYASLYDFIDVYYNEGITFHPETYVGIHLERTGLNNKRTSINNWENISETIDWWDWKYNPPPKSCTSWWGWYSFEHPKLGLNYERKR